MTNPMIALEMEYLTMLKNQEKTINSQQEQMAALIKNANATNDKLQNMLDRFKVDGSYPGGVDVMTSDFRACFPPNSAIS